MVVQAGISDAIDKISQLCYNYENQFREGVIGACTWQILKNETHVYFISVTEIEYTWVFFYGSGADEYAKEKKNAVIYESAFYPVYCGNG